MNRFALLIATAALVGCGDPVPTGGAKLAPKAPVKVEGAEAASSEVDEYFYNPAGKRDPFQSFLKREDPVSVVENAPPLQRWDVDKYLLRGVIWDTSSPRALLVDPEGMGHSIRPGTYVGRNWGKVTSISEGCVVVTEEYQTLDGELVVNPVTVCFPTEARK
ncbi:MAG: pilus assembly protein PilP [Pseudomonadota bacterium]|nr:pilus assembly protein PilP [Pseudomonadota bacterium]